MRPWVTVFRKETLEMLRDRRVVTNAVIVPMAIIILMAQLIAFVSHSVRKTQLQSWHVIQQGSDNQIVRELEKTGKDRIKFVKNEDEARQLIADGKAKIVLKFSDHFDEDLQKGQVKIRALFDSGEQTSEISLGAFQQILDKANKQAVETTLTASGLPKTAAEPIVLEKVDTAKKDSLGNGFLISFIPYLVVLYAFYGGLGTASDLVAGEKERGTLETLLIAPISRTDIAMGKFLSLALICLVSSLMTVVGILLIGMLKLPGHEMMFPEGVKFSMGMFGMMSLVLVPLVAFFAALLVAISAYAKNMREAQTYIALLNIVVLIPAIFVQVLGVTDLGRQTWIFVAPILGTAANIRAILLGKPEWTNIGLTVVTISILAAAMLALAVHMMRREKVLARI